MELRHDKFNPCQASINVEIKNCVYLDLDAVWRVGSLFEADVPTIDLFVIVPISVAFGHERTVWRPRLHLNRAKDSNCTSTRIAALVQFDLWLWDKKCGEEADQ